MRFSLNNTRTRVIQSFFILTFTLSIGLLVGQGQLHAQRDSSNSDHLFISFEEKREETPDYDGILLTIKDGGDSSRISVDGWMETKDVPGTSMVAIYPEQRLRNVNLEETIKEFKADPNVIAAQPNFKYHLFATPNDTSFSDQWALENTGQVIGGSTGLVDFDLDGAATWDVENVANPIVTVAVIDTGADLNHPDLSGNLVAGYDFTEDDVNPYDYHGHGTHVAGIIAATSNNTTGVSGVSIKNRIKVMPLKTVNFTTSELVAAINYAQANGADIINASWGGGSWDPAMYTAIGNFSGLFVAAAGNESSDNDAYPHYPASYALDNVVAVGSYANNGVLSSFSNYGSTVDLYAPGTHILNTYPLFTPLAEEDFTSIALGTDLSDTPFTETSGDWGVINPSCTGCDNGVTIGTGRSYVNNASDILTLTTPVDASVDTEPPVLKFFLDANIQYSASCTNDYLAIETDNNNDIWTEVTRICGGWSNDLEIGLPSADPTLRFRFKWVTDSSVTGTAPFIDDIELLTYGAIDHGYAYLSGTSMSSPYVAGEIAMVMSETPGLSNADLKELVSVHTNKGITNLFASVIGSSTIFDSWVKTEGVVYANPISTVFSGTWHEFVVGLNKRLYTRERETLAEWNLWGQDFGYSTSGPAMAEFSSKLYQSVKGGDNRIYNRSSSDGLTWSAWVKQIGYTTSAPSLATYNGRLYQSVRGGDNKVYNRYSTDGTTWSAWAWEQGKTEYPPSMVEYNGDLYQAVVGMYTTDTYIRSLNSGFVWSAWENAGGTAGTQISMAVFNNRLYQSYADPDTDMVLLRSYSVASDWTHEVFLSGSTNYMPTLTVFDSKLYQKTVGGGGSLYERVIK